MDKKFLKCSEKKINIWLSDVEELVIKAPEKLQHGPCVDVIRDYVGDNMILLMVLDQ